MTTPKKIYDIYIHARASAALAVCLRLGIFKTIALKPCFPEAIARIHNLHIRGALALLKAMSACDILIHNKGQYTLSEDAKIYLLPESPLYLGALIDLENDFFLTPHNLLRAAQTGQPSVYGEEDVWHSHQEDEEQARAFTQAMHSISAQPARALSELSIWKNCSKVLDIGAGSGALSICVAQSHHQLRFTLLDMPQICTLAQEYIDKALLTNRISVHPSDMFDDPFPDRHDTVLFSQILHDWTPKQGMQLLQKAVLSMPDGGWIIIHEKLTQPHNNHKPLANALVNLDMLIWTQGQQYSYRDLHVMLTDIGCTHIEGIPTTGYWSAVIAAVPTSAQ